MKTTITEYEFTQGFVDVDRGNNFSYEGRKALFEYFEELEESIGEEIEYDPIAICVEFSEYENLEDFCLNYGKDYETLEDIENETTVIRHTQGFIIQDF